MSNYIMNYLNSIIDNIPEEIITKKFNEYINDLKSNITDKYDNFIPIKIHYKILYQ